MAYLDDSATKIASFEGAIPYLYLDNAVPPNATAAIGMMLPNVASSQALPWYIHDFSRAATANEIAQDFARVTAMRGGMMAVQYRGDAGLSLTDTDMLSMLKSELGGIDAQLAAMYPSYSGWPEPAKLATLDMAYNLGLGELRTGYPVFNRAANDEEWLTCAAQCHRFGPSVARNSWTSEQFSQAYSLKVSA